MPQTFDVEGVGTLEFPDDVKPEEIQEFLDKNYNKTETSALGAAGRAAGTSIVPTGVGMAAAAPFIPYATAAAPATYGLSYLVPLAVGAGASWLAGKAQEPVLKKAFPELEELQKADIEQHPYAAMGGRFAAVAPFAEFSPGQGISALASIPKAIAGSREAKKAVAGLGLNIGLQEAMTVGQSLATKGELPSPMEMVESGAAGVAYGKMRGPLGRLAGHVDPASIKRKPQADPEVRLQREQEILKKIDDDRTSIADQAPDTDPYAVAHTAKDGSITLYRNNLHERLEQELSKGATMDEALSTIVSEETIHGATKTIKKGDELADEYWKLFTRFERENARRRYQGEGGKERSDTDMGHEAIRFALQGLQDQAPGEHIFGTTDEVRISKFLTVLNDVIGGIRNKLGTKASSRQQEILDIIQAYRNSIKKGTPDAIQPEAAQPVRPVREEPIKGKGEMSEAERRAADDERRGKEEQLRKDKVLLGPNAPMPDEVLVDAAYVHDDNVIHTAPHHPGALEKAGGKELSDKYPTRESREGPGVEGAVFGYSTNRRRFVPRELGTRIAELSGQDLRTWEQKVEGTPIHSDEADSVKGPGTIAEQTPVSGPKARPSTDSLKKRASGMTDDEIRSSLGTIHSTINDPKVSTHVKENVSAFAEILKDELWNRQQKKAPPVAPTKGAPPAQAQAGLATAPPAAATAGGPAAKTIISTAFPEVKMRELDALNREIVDPKFDALSKEGQAKYDRWVKLSDELDKAEGAAGLGPVPQGSEMLAMSRKGLPEPEEGMVRLYSGSGGAGIGSSWFTSNIERARSHGGSVRFVDVPKSVADSSRQPIKSDYVLPPDWVNKADIVPDPGGQRVWEVDEALAMSRKGAPADPNEVAKEIGFTYNPTKQIGAVSLEGLSDRDLAALKAAGRGPDWEFTDRRKGSPTEGFTFYAPEGSSREDIISRANELGSKLAMSRKVPETAEGRVVAKVMQIVGGMGDDPVKTDLVTQIAKQILSLPKDQWPKALTEFHAQWKSQDIANADNEIRQKGVTPAGVSDELMDKIKKGEALNEEDLSKLQAAEQLGEALGAENIARVFGTADRQTAYRSALYVLNRPVEAITPPSDKGIPKILPAGGEPVSTAVRPKYKVGDYNEWWPDFHERYPHIPENVAIEVWNQSVDDVLVNASGERIKELLRPAGLEGRFLGKASAPQVGEKATEYQKTEARRTMPDADPEPIFADMAKAPSPADSAKFKRFCAARDLTPEQGIEVLNRMREHQTAELASSYAMLEGTKPEITGKASKKISWATGTRDPLTESEKRDLSTEWRKGRAMNLKRRESAISELSKWLKKEVSLPERDPMRRIFSLEDIWWDRRSIRSPYASYDLKQGEDASFLKSAFAPKRLKKGGEKSNTDSKRSRALAILVDRKTGDYHAVSVYVKDGLPRFYDPNGVVGSREKSFIDIQQILSRYRFAASAIVKDPLYHFHQKWASEPGKSGEQKYSEEIGAVAKLKENSATEQWMEYLNEKEAERQEQEKEAFIQRFEEDEPAGAGEEGPVSSIRQQRIEERKAQGLAEWSDIEDPDVIARGKPMTAVDRASIEAWMKGPGTGTLGLYQADLRSLVNPHLNGGEADALYQLLGELKITGPASLAGLVQHFGGLSKVISSRGLLRRRLSGRDVSALYGMNKISMKIYERMKRSPYEQAKLKDLPEIPEGTEYIDMTPGEKEHFVALESLKYRALLRTFNEVYELANEARNTPRGKDEIVEGLAISPDVKAFRTKSLDRYGDTARRSIQSAAISEGRPPEISGERSLLAGSKFGGMPRTRGEILTRLRAELPEKMLPPEAAKYEEAPPPVGAFPTIPTTPGKLGGKKFTGKPPDVIPERGTPVGYGQERGFIPSGPTRHELLTGKFPPERNLLREPGTQQLVMRKIWRQAEGFPPEEPLAMARKRQTESPEFKSWFGGSKVVDKNEKPQVYYHATNARKIIGHEGEGKDWKAIWGDKNFTVFTPGSHFGTKNQVNQFIFGHQIDTDQHAPTVYPVYLSIKNPKRISDVQMNWETEIAKAKEEGYDGIVYRNDFEPNVPVDKILMDWPKYRAEADTKKPFEDLSEGAKYARFFGKGEYWKAKRNRAIKEDKRADSYIAFYPEQVKSAIGNVGAFDPSNPDILAMTRKGYGPSRRAQEEMVEQGRALPRPEEDKPVVPKQQLIAEGRDLVTSGKINPEKEMRQFERTGYMSVKSALTFRYWGYRLQGIADAAASDPRFGARSKEFLAAEARSNSWQRRLEASAGEMFARTGHSLQGWNQIGPDDMKSTTFVRRFLKKARAKQLDVDEDSFDLSDEDMSAAERIAARVTQAEQRRGELEMLVGQEASKGLDPDLDPGNQKLVSEFDKVRKSVRSAAAGALRKGKPTSSAMAMKGEPSELPKLDSYTEDQLGNLGMDVMAELSKAGELTDQKWLQEMSRILSSEEVGRPDLEPYLPHIRAVSEEIRNTAINNYIGTGDAVKDARKIFTRKRPPIEESIAAIHRALEADPSGETMTPAESYHIWSYLKTRFLDKDSPTHTLDFREIRTKASAELGVKDDTGKIVEGKEYSQLRLFRAMSSNRTMRKMTEEVIRRIRDEARIKGQAMNWLKNQQFPGWLRTARMFPRLFFMDKIAGHGLVPMITHASNMMFNPMAWSVYFGSYKNGKFRPGAWAQMYKMTGLPTEKGQFKARLYHESVLAEMTGHENFERWKRAGLQADPFKYTDDYQIEALQKVFKGKMDFLFGGRGFDALKTLRYAMAEKWLKSLPEHLQNDKSMQLIADSVNHATGIVKTPFHESLNWLMFAPKLEASRWAYMIKDTVKAADYIRNWKVASMEQRAWAISDLKQKAMVVGWYYGMLALNQAFLKMSGSDQDVNITDPQKPDFMSFKIAGFKVGVMSPLIGVVKLFANAIHAAFGERTKFEKMTTRQKQLYETAGTYLRGKASPFTSFGLDFATQHDYRGRPLPWSSEQLRRSQALKGMTTYGVGEYLSQTFAPIPAEEAIKDTFKSMGMGHYDAERLVRTLIIAGGMSATGARIQEIEE